MHTIRDHKDVIEQWDGITLFAADAGMEESYARCIKSRNNIPPVYWPAIIAGAKKRGKGFITWELLHATRRRRGRLAA